MPKTQIPGFSSIFVSCSLSQASSLRITFTDRAIIVSKAAVQRASDQPYVTLSMFVCALMSQARQTQERTRNSQGRSSP